jgi:hypothetical protein
MVGLSVDEVICRIVPAMDNSMTCIGNIFFTLNLLQVLVIDETIQDTQEGIVVTLDVRQLILGTVRAPRILFLGRGICKARNLGCSDLLYRC